MSTLGLWERKRITDRRDIMPRPKKSRWVEGSPCATYFKPQGIPCCEIEEVTLTIEELEAVRLKDGEGLEQEECARQMQISRPTFVRLVQGARKKIALALTQGKGLRIEGGNHQFYGQKRMCHRNGGVCRHHYAPDVNSPEGTPEYTPEEKE